MNHKVPLEVKMEALELLQSGKSVKSVSNQLKRSPGELQTWRLIFEEKGEKSLAEYPKNVCTDDIKRKIICIYREKSVPLHTISARYSIPYTSVVRCVSTYKHKGWAGVKGAVIDLRNLLRTGDLMEEELTKVELKQQLKEVMNELEYLRAENALLKKVKALVEASERKNRHSRKPSNH